MRLRAGSRTTTAALAAVGALLLVVLPASGATAEPTPSAGEVAAARAAARSVAADVGVLEAQLAQAQARLDALGAAVAEAAEAYNGAVYELERARAAAAAAAARAAAAGVDLDAARRDVGRLAAASYKMGGSLGGMAAFASGQQASSVLGTAATLEALGRRQDAVLDRVRVQGVVTEVLRRQASDAVAEQQAAADRAAAAKAAVEARVQDQAGQVSELTALRTVLRGQLAQALSRSSELAEARRAGLARAAQERAAAERRARAAAREARERAGGGGTPVRGGSSSSRGTTAGAATAIDFARAQLGEPYVYAAAGPDSWDCSGLTMMAWRAGGVDLPHWSVAQYDVSKPVSAAEVRPGDLVFFAHDPADFRSIYHVGLYVGDGMMIDAPHPGATVRLTDVYAFEFYGFARP